jgi:hypothetical protein
MYVTSWLSPQDGVHTPFDWPTFKEVAVEGSKGFTILEALLIIPICIGLGGKTRLIFILSVGNPGATKLRQQGGVGRSWIFW